MRTSARNEAGLDPLVRATLADTGLVPTLQITPAARSQSAGGAYPTCVRSGGFARVSAAYPRADAEVWRSSRWLAPSSPLSLSGLVGLLPQHAAHRPYPTKKKNNQNRGSRPCALTPTVRNVVRGPDSTRGEAARTGPSERLARPCIPPLSCSIDLFSARSGLTAVAQHATVLCTGAEQISRYECFSRSTANR